MATAATATGDVWIETTCDEIYYATLHGKWDDVRGRIWLSDDGVKYKINAQNVADVYVPAGTKRTRESSAETDDHLGVETMGDLLDEPMGNLLDEPCLKRNAAMQFENARH